MNDRTFSPNPRKRGKIHHHQLKLLSPKSILGHPPLPRTNKQTNKKHTHLLIHTQTSRQTKMQFQNNSLMRVGIEAYHAILVPTSYPIPWLRRTGAAYSLLMPNPVCDCDWLKGSPTLSVADFQLPFYSGICFI